MFELFADLSHFICKLTLKHHFAIKDLKKQKLFIKNKDLIMTNNSDTDNMNIYSELEDSSEIIGFLNKSIATTLKKKSNFYHVQNRGGYIESFYKLVLEDFNRLRKQRKKKIPHNLAHKERKVEGSINPSPPCHPKYGQRRRLCATKQRWLLERSLQNHG